MSEKRLIKQVGTCQEAIDNAIKIEREACAKVAGETEEGPTE